MQYIKQEILGYTSTNLIDIYNDWSPTTTYILETDDSALTNASVVRYGTYYYRSLTNGNLNFNPEQYENIKWIKLGVSNKYAMLDAGSNSKSIVNGGNLTVTFLQNKIRNLGIGNYEAETINIQVLDSNGTTVLWDYTTESSANDEVDDYYSYIYADYNYEVDRAKKIDIPIEGTYIKITFNKQVDATRTACGFLIGGVAVDMGKTLMGVKFAFNSFAEREYTPLGGLNIIKKAVQDLVDFETVIPSGELQNMRREIRKIYNEIVLFILVEEDFGNYENMMTLGVIQDASVLLDNSVEAMVTFSVVEAI